MGSQRVVHGWNDLAFIYMLENQFKYHSKSKGKAYYTETMKSKITDIKRRELVFLKKHFSIIEKENCIGHKKKNPRNIK